jgi:hypothetical protein
MDERRFAVVATRQPDQVPAYLPANYDVLATFAVDELDVWDPERIIDGHAHVVIAGTDHAGWTLDEYVIPRLLSGLHACAEIDEQHPALKRVPEAALVSVGLAEAV